MKKIAKGLTGERYLGSYDAVDLAKGKAIQTLYGAKSNTLYHLSDNLLYSGAVTTTSTTRTVGKIIDIDFDIEFNKVAIIEGEAFVNVCLGMYSENSGTSPTQSIKAVAKFRKWDGVTETELGNGETAVISLSGYLQLISGMRCAVVDITRTKFGIGDYLRLTIEIEITAAGGTCGVYSGFAHDPKNRNDNGTTQIINDTDDTVMMALVPFKLEL